MNSITRLSAGLGLFVLLSISTLAAYIPEYTWDFDTMFSTTSALGNADSEGNTVWEYRHANWDATPGPSALMGTWVSWETPQAWRADGGGSNGAKIATNALVSSSGNSACAEVAWIAPVDCTVNMGIDLSGRTGNNSRFEIWSNGIKIEDTTDYSGTDWNWYSSDLTLSAGEEIVFLLVPWGTGTTSYSGFDMAASIVPEPSSVFMFIVGIATLLGYMKRCS